MSEGAVLECVGLDAGYGQLAVARGINLSVVPGEILAVLGPNGAGKTTILLTIAGFLTPLAGEILVEGQPAKAASPRRMNRAGVVLVPDFRALFSELTPLEHLQLAAGRSGDIEPLLELFPALARRAQVQAGDLSGGEQQMLAIARALIQKPKVLLIDEMSMGLAPVIVESLMPVLRQAASERGAAIIMVEQHVHLALEVADHAVVLVHGEVTQSGPAAEVRQAAAALENAYLSGQSAADA